jgi:hypothetical protein
MAAMHDEDFQRALQEAERKEMPQFYMSYVLLAAMHGHLGNPAGAREAVTIRRRCCVTCSPEKSAV